MNCCFYSTPRNVVSWREMVDLAAEHHMDRLEILASKEFATPDRAAARTLREYADERGVSVCCFSMGAELTGEDAPQQIQRVIDYGEIAHILGSPLLHFTVCKEYRDYPRILAQKEELFRRSIAAVREIADAIAPLGLKAVFENQGFLFNGLEGTARLLKEAERPIGLVADFGNIRQVGEEILPWLRAFAPYVAQVHLKDSVTEDTPAPQSLPVWDGRYVREVEPLKGTVPLAEGIALLKELGYQGAYSIEFATEDPALRRKIVENISRMTE